MIRKFICWIIGHRYRCLFRKHWDTENGRGEGSETTHWECQSCGKLNSEQWDT